MDTADMDTPFLTRPDIRGHFGVAASTHWLAAQTAMRMLELGGNAFDGAVAAGFVLQVAEPHLNGPLGEVPILLHEAELGGLLGQVTVIFVHGAILVNERERKQVKVNVNVNELAAATDPSERT